MHTIAKISYYFFLVVLIAIGGLLVATLFPIEGNIQVKIVQSGSMEPAIRTGSIVLIKPSNSYFKGDIVTFGEDTKNTVPTTHRIVEEEIVEGTFFFTTKGDANEDPDTNKLSQDDIIGRVLFSFPYMGFVLDFARKPVGFALLIGIPVLVIVVDELSKILKEVSKMREKKRKETIIGTAKDARAKREERLKRKKIQLGVTHRFMKAPGPPDKNAAAAEDSPETATKEAPGFGGREEDSDDNTLDLRPPTHN